MSRDSFHPGCDLRSQLRSFAAVFVFLASLAPLAAQDGDGDGRLTVLVWNTERGSNPYGPDGKRRVLEVVRASGADLVLWQESYALEGEGRTLAAYVADELGWTHHQGASPHLALATRLSIGETFAHEPWHGVGARLVDEQGREFVAWSVWLDARAYLPYAALAEPAPTDEELLARESRDSGRLGQTQDLLFALDGLGHLGLDVPLLVGGDWNTPSHLDWTADVAADGRFAHRRALALPVSRLLAAAGFADVFRALHPDPLHVPAPTWSPLLERIDGSDRLDPPERIDRLYLRQRGGAWGLRPRRAETLPRDWAEARLPRETSPFPSDHAALRIEFEWVRAPDLGELVGATRDDGRRASADLEPRAPAKLDPDFVLERFAFGSCYQQREPCPTLETLARHEPQLYVALGDNLYGDTEDLDLLRRRYRQLARQPAWRALAERTPIVATWDDHDYGADDAGREYPRRAESKALLLEFFGEPAQSERRARPGIHTSYLFGPPERAVQIVLLDLRTFRAPLARGGAPPYPELGPYRPLGEDEEQVLLGEEQWRWLEGELRVPARLRFIGLSTQLGVGFNGFESWANLPRERARFFELLRASGAEGVVLLSGDTHWAELSLEEQEGLYPVYDLTSSALNQRWSPIGANERRVGPAFGGPNFGSVEIDWSSVDPRVRLAIHDASGEVRLSLDVRRSELTFAGARGAELQRGPAPRTVLGRWNSAFGELEITRVSPTRYEARYPGGRADIRKVGDTFEGTWREGEREGRCRFRPTRCGRFLLGAYGRGAGPVSLAWPCWRPDAAGFFALPE